MKMDRHNIMDNMIAHTFFYLALVLFFMHEMDAIRCKEWRIFPGLSLLNERWGYPVFMLAHIPLFLLLIWVIAQPSENFIIGFDMFSILHFGLHLLYLKHKKNEFKDWISWALITGIAVCGGIDLLL